MRSFLAGSGVLLYNPAKMRSARVVTVRRIRLRDSVEYVWWLSKTPWPKANNRSVLRPYSKDMVRLNRKGLNAKSAHPVTVSLRASVRSRQADRSRRTLSRRKSRATCSSLVITRLMTSTPAAARSPARRSHPARFPSALPEFFLKLVTEEGDLVLDPFAGSNTTGAVAESLHLRWIAVDNVLDYLEASKFRFFT